MFREVEFLKQAKGLRPLEDLSGAVSAYDQNSLDYFHLLFRDEECEGLYATYCILKMVLTQTDQRLGISLGIATEENLEFVKCRCKENYEQVKKTPIKN